MSRKMFGHFSIEAYVLGVCLKNITGKAYIICARSLKNLSLGASNLVRHKLGCTVQPQNIVRGLKFCI